MPVAPSPFHLIPAAKSELLVVVATMTLLFVDQPAKWFTERTDGVPPGGNVMSLLLISVAGYGLFNISFRFDKYLELFSAEPLLPLLLGLMALSTLWSGAPSRTMDTTLALVAVTAIGMWLTVRFPLSTIVGMAAAACTISALLNIAFVVALPKYGVGADGWMGALPNRNLLGRNSTMAFGLLLVAMKTHRRWRLPLVCATLITAVLLVGAESKTSLVGGLAVAGMVVGLPLLRARRTLYGAIALAFIGMVGGFAYLVYGNLSLLSTSLGREANLTGRTEIWPPVLRAIGERPLWGYGWNGFWTDWSGPSGKVWKEIGFRAAHAHNGPMEAALGIGLVGAGIFLAIFVRTAVRGARVIRFYRSSIGMFPLILLTSVVSASVTEFGILVHDLFYLLFVVAVLAAARGRREALAGALGTQSSQLPSERRT